MHGHGQTNLQESVGPPRMERTSGCASLVEGPASRSVVSRHCCRTEAQGRDLGMLPRPASRLEPCMKVHRHESSPLISAVPCIRADRWRCETRTSARGEGKYRHNRSGAPEDWFLDFFALRLA